MNGSVLKAVGSCFPVTATGRCHACSRPPPSLRPHLHTQNVGTRMRAGASCSLVTPAGAPPRQREEATTPRDAADTLPAVGGVRQCVQL
jgi:hypothetical protein